MRRGPGAALLLAATMAACSGVRRSAGSSAGAQPPARVPSNVAWTEQTVWEASAGDALRGLVLARHCDHCHGAEGFSAIASIPNLAGMERLALWKQMEDFASRKRNSAVMSAIATGLTAKDFADLGAYYEMLPTSGDPLDRRAFPEAPIAGAQATRAGQLIVLGDAKRGLPPCQSCHGPVGFKRGAPPLAVQNGDYVVAQLRDFASGARANDIDMPMRTVAGLLTEEERQTLAAYYGSGLGQMPPGAVFAQ